MKNDIAVKIFCCIKIFSAQKRTKVYEIVLLIHITIFFIFVIKKNNYVIIITKKLLEERCILEDFGIDKSWIDAGLDINLINEVMTIIAEKRIDRLILPSQEDVLNAIKLTSLDNVKVLIIGQDPYPSSEHAHGLAFSSLSAKTPASLKNIFKKLKEDFPEGKYESNTLTRWGEQGVVLLNTSLTFEGKDPKLLKEHTKLWEPVVKNIFEVLIKRNKTLVVMRWGNYAQKVGECFNNKPNVYTLDTTHPSPFSARNGFLTSSHFKLCNEILVGSPICWDT